MSSCHHVRMTRRLAAQMRNTSKVPNSDAQHRTKGTDVESGHCAASERQERERRLRTETKQARQPLSSPRGPALRVTGQGGLPPPATPQPLPQTIPDARQTAVEN